MNRSYGNLPIAWANSPSIVFNKRTSGWMPPAYSTLKGRNQIVQVDDNMNFVRELSNDFPPAQVAVWDTPQGMYGPANAIPGAPYPPGAAALSGALGDLGAFLETAPTSLPIVGGPIAAFKDFIEDMLGTTLGKVVYFGTLAAVMIFLLGQFKFGRKLTAPLAKVPVLGKLVKRKNPAVPRRWKSKKYAKRHGKRKMSAAYMKRHNRKRSRRSKR